MAYNCCTRVVTYVRGYSKFLSSAQEKFCGIVEFVAPALLLLLLSLIYAGTILGRIIAKHGKQNYYYYHYVVVGIIFILLSFFSYERHIFEHYGNKFRIRDDIVATMG